MTWEALQVEEILRSADAVISPASVEADLGARDVMKMMTLARTANAATKLPHGADLSDVIAPESYALWSELRQVYLPDDSKVERQRPMFASQALYYGAIESEGLTRANVAWNSISARAATLGVPIVETRVRLPLELDRARYKSGIKALASSQLDDRACFVRTLENLRPDLERMKIGANAWATGDIKRLLQLRHAEIQPPCKKIYDAAMGFQAKPEWDHAARVAWLEAVDAALSKNSNTLTVAPVNELAGPSGILAAFEARGYAVFGPENEDGADGASDD